MVTFVLPDPIMGIGIVSGWGTSLLLSIIKQKVCKSALQAITSGLAIWEPVKLPEPTVKCRSRSAGGDRLSVP